MPNKKELTNKELLEKYPFLVLRNSYTGEIIKQSDPDNPHIEFKYDIPPGWWKCFGIALLDDIKEIMDKHNMKYEDFMFHQVKEKYGSICIYHNGMPEEWSSHEHAWEYISEHTCVECGIFPVPMRYFSWISPFCDNCIKSHRAWSKELEDKITEKGWSGRVQEYIVVSHFSKEGDYQEWIDMKPFYDKIGWKYTDKDLISKEEIEELIKKRKKEEGF